MELEKSLLNGMVKPFAVIDHILQSQGFSRRGDQTVTYHIHIEDTASHTVYFLRIPAHHKGGKGTDGALLQLDRPYVGKLRGPSRFQSTQHIPKAVIEAAQHKLAEIASYLQTMSEKPS